jgi:hypothetical protein
LTTTTKKGKEKAMRKSFLLAPAFIFLMTVSVFAQSAEDQELDYQAESEDQSLELEPSDTDKIRIGVKFMAGYIHDSSVAALGYEKQGRIGYAIINISGRMDDNFSYVMEFNPVNESSPLPTCGEEGFFYPNIPQNFGPKVQCVPGGRLRVDDYKFIALDPMNQQGAVRQALLRYQKRGFGFQFGRFILPIGFNWEEAGSFTAKDATHIQRINAENNFGISLDQLFGPVTVTVAAFLGDGNKFRDYTYFYFQDGSLDSNSALTTLFSAKVEPMSGLDLRISWKKGYTGSKVERVPNYWASKRHDDAVVFSAQYRANQFVRVFSEYAHYTWGPTRTSAEMLGFNTEPIEKPGYYVGADLSVPITDKVRVGTVITREELSRDDSLVSFLSQSGYNVQMGRKERSTVYRFYADISDMVTVGIIRNNLSNPYAWVSGIEPMVGPNPGAANSGNDKWGLVVMFRAF